AAQKRNRRPIFVLTGLGPAPAPLGGQDKDVDALIKFAQDNRNEETDGLFRRSLGLAGAGALLSVWPCVCLLGSSGSFGSSSSPGTLICDGAEPYSSQGQPRRAR